MPFIIEDYVHVRRYGSFEILLSGLDEESN